MCQYPFKKSDTIYIGLAKTQTFQERFKQHYNPSSMNTGLFNYLHCWICKVWLRILDQRYNFRNQEAELLRDFTEEYGSIPIVLQTDNLMVWNLTSLI